MISPRSSSTSLALFCSGQCTVKFARAVNLSNTCSPSSDSLIVDRNAGSHLTTVKSFLAKKIINFVWESRKIIMNLVSVAIMSGKIRALNSYSFGVTHSFHSNLSLSLTFYFISLNI